MAAALNRRDDEDAGDTSGKARAANPRSTLSTAGVFFGHTDLCAVSSSHDVVEKSPGTPLVLVISSDDELEVSSSRRLVRSASPND